MITDVPSDAITIYYKADNGKSGPYHIWRRVERVNGVKQDQWYWQSLGNGGTGDCAQEVTASARAWIRDGLRSKIN